MGDLLEIRLNTKIAHRKLEVIDLVKDLSDGVSSLCEVFLLER